MLDTSVMQFHIEAIISLGIFVIWNYIFFIWKSILETRAGLMTLFRRTLLSVRISGCLRA